MDHDTFTGLELHGVKWLQIRNPYSCYALSKAINSIIQNPFFISPASLQIFPSHSCFSHIIESSAYSLLLSPAWDYRTLSHSFVWCPCRSQININVKCQGVTSPLSCVGWLLSLCSARATFACSQTDIFPSSGVCGPANRRSGTRANKWMWAPLFTSFSTRKQYLQISRKCLHFFN